jgi:hypothetical protein
MALWIIREDPHPVFDVSDVLDGIEKVRVFPRDDGEQP